MGRKIGFFLLFDYNRWWIATRLGHLRWYSYLACGLQYCRFFVPVLLFGHFSFYNIVNFQFVRYLKLYACHQSGLIVHHYWSFSLDSPLNWNFWPYLLEINHPWASAKSSSSAVIHLPGFTFLNHLGLLNPKYGRWIVG